MSRIVWLASYPKSGNTWVRLFLAALGDDRDVDLSRQGGLSSIASSRAELERLLDLNLGDLSPDEAAELRPLAYRELTRRAGPPIPMKTHDLYGATPSGLPMFPGEASAGCIHILRDPRDVCLSMAAHDGVDVDEAIERLSRATRTTPNANKQQLRELRGSWSEHCASWRRAPMPRLDIRYEDMLADPLRHLGAVARFCGRDPAPAALARAVARTSFEKLAAQEAAHGFAERPGQMERFFRTGRAGGWREALSPAQIARIESDHAAMMRVFGYLPEATLS
jgi:aryl sulfotransferase